MPTPDDHHRESPDGDAHEDIIHAGGGTRRARRAERRARRAARKDEAAEPSPPAQPPPPPAAGWDEARRHWMESPPPKASRRRTMRASVDRPDRIPVGKCDPDRLPAAVRLLPDVHAGAELDGVHLDRLRGREVVVFEHAWSIGLVQIDLTVRSVIAAVEVPPWPALRIRPRRGILRRPGRGELRLEHEAFTRRFRVQATDEDFAILLLDPELQAWLAAGPRATWQLVPGALAMIRPGRLRPIDGDLEAALAGLEGFLDRVPPELAYWNA